MTDEKDRSSFGKDILGLVLGAIALFLGVSIVMSVAKGAPEDPGQMNQIHRMVDAYTGFVGHWPGLAICLALVVFGVVLFVGGPRDTSLRNLLGILGTGFALAVLFGAITAGAGGLVGKVGGIVTGGLGLPFGLIFSGIVLFATLWFAWLRGTDLFSRKTSHAGNPPDEIDKDAYEGVSDEEARALLPQLRRARKEAEPEVEPEVELPPLYPEDVRRKGLIPEGTRPLESSHEPTPSPPPMATGAESATEAAAPAVEPGGDLAAPGLDEPRAEDLGAPTAGEVEALTAQPFVAPPDPVPSWERSEPERTAPDPEPHPEPVAAVPDAPVEPSAEPADDEAPFDAAEDYEYDDDEADELTAAAPRDVAEPTPVATTTSATAEPGEEPTATAEAAPEESGGSEDSEEPEARDEEWEYEDDDDESEEPTEAQAEADDEEWEYEDVDDESEEPTEAQAEADDEEWEYEDDDDESEEPTEAQAEADDEEWEYEDEDDAEEPVAEGEPAADEDTGSSAARDGGAPPAEASSKEEREVTLAPQPAPETEGFPSQDLLRRAGDLILERQRVAVSLLQRTFELDFKQATLLLDSLQEQGLIGPYLGGQKRDILLTADEWRARV